jgi:hypothetical protein
VITLACSVGTITSSAAEDSPPRATPPGIQAVGADTSSAGLDRLPARRSAVTSAWALAMRRGSPLRLAAASCRRMCRASPRDVRPRAAWVTSACTRSYCSLLFCMSFNSCHLRPSGTRHGRVHRSVRLSIKCGLRFVLRWLRWTLLDMSTESARAQCGGGSPIVPLVSPSRRTTMQFGCVFTPMIMPSPPVT